MKEIIESLRKWSSEFIEENGGNGGQEIRNWLVLLGALQSFEPDIACYEPIPEWVTGMAIVQLAPVGKENQKDQSSKHSVSI